MTITYNIFCIFATLTVISAAMTIAASNPIHSVFYLIFTFVNASALFFLLGVEFLAVIFLIVYVGAVSILFLFVVMMLNIKLVEWTESLTRFVPITLIIGLIFLSQATALLDSFSNTNLLSPTDNLNLWFNVEFTDWVRSFISFSNVEILGQYLYTDFSFLFLLSSMILLVAMIGAIILSLDHHRNIKRQDLFSQISTRSTVSLMTTRQFSMGSSPKVFKNNTNMCQKAHISTTVDTINTVVPHLDTISSHSEAICLAYCEGYLPEQIYALNKNSILGLNGEFKKSIGDSHPTHVPSEPLVTESLILEGTKIAGGLGLMTKSLNYKGSNAIKSIGVLLGATITMSAGHWWLKKPDTGINLHTHISRKLKGEAGPTKLDIETYSNSTDDKMKLFKDYLDLTPQIIKTDQEVFIQRLERKNWELSEDLVRDMTQNLSNVDKFQLSVERAEYFNNLIKWEKGWIPNWISSKPQDPIISETWKRKIEMADKLPSSNNSLNIILDNNNICSFTRPLPDINEIDKYLDNLNFTFIHDLDYLMENSLNELYSNSNNLIENTLNEVSSKSENLTVYEPVNLTDLWEFYRAWMGTPYAEVTSNLYFLHEIFMVIISLSVIMGISTLIFVEQLKIFLDTYSNHPFFKYPYVRPFYNIFMKFRLNYKWIAGLSLYSIIITMFYRLEAIKIFSTLYTLRKNKYNVSGAPNPPTDVPYIEPQIDMQDIMLSDNLIFTENQSNPLPTLMEIFKLWLNTPYDQFSVEFLYLHTWIRFLFFLIFIGFILLNISIYLFIQFLYRTPNSKLLNYPYIKNFYLALYTNDLFFFYIQMLIYFGLIYTVQYYIEIHDFLLLYFAEYKRNL